jgi:hemerythrin-like domain-containing protein
MHSSVSVAGPESPIDLPAFLDGFRAIHRAMRRDVTRLERVAPGVGDRRRARRLARWYDHFLVSIEHHHQRDDLVVWPLLIDREPGFAAETATLEHDHEVLDEALHAVARALRDLADGIAADPAPLVAAAARLRHHLDEHLDREEAAAFPRIARNFTAEEYHRLEEELREGLPMSALAFEAPWVLDGLPQEQAAGMIGDAPVALRVLYHLAFRPRYRRIAAVLAEASR